MKFLLLLILSTSALSQQKLTTVYVNHETGSDANIPCSAKKPLKTFSKAMKLIKESGTIFIQKTSTPYKEALHVNIGGTVANPLNIIADKAVIDLGLNISAGPWIKEGDSFILNKVVNREFKDAQRAALFVNSIPIHPYTKNLRESYHVSCLEDGRLKVLFPNGINPLDNKNKITLNGPVFSNAVSFGKNASNIIIKGLTAKHSGNDGFNLHGSSKNILLDGVTASYNGDEGISAHEDIELKVTHSIISNNGSSAGGIADINESISTYHNCLVVNNYSNAFYFIGKEHNIKDCIIWGNRNKLHFGKTTILNEANIYQFNDRKDALSELKSLPKPLQNLVLSFDQNNL